MQVQNVRVSKHFAFSSVTFPFAPFFLEWNSIKTEPVKRERQAIKCGLDEISNFYLNPKLLDLHLRSRKWSKVNFIHPQFDLVESNPKFCSSQQSHFTPNFPLYKNEMTIKLSLWGKHSIPYLLGEEKVSKRFPILSCKEREYSSLLYLSF